MHPNQVQSVYVFLCWTKCLLLKEYESGWRNRLWTPFQKNYRYILILVMVGLFLLGWQLVISSGKYLEFVLPTPTSVWQMFLKLIVGDELWYHARVTLTEALTGFGLGLPTASVLG